MSNGNRSLKKLDSIAKFLKLSGKFYFVNYNLKLFYDFILNDNEIGAIIQKLLLKYPAYENDAFDVLSNPNSNLQDYRGKDKIATFEEMVAFCIFYVKASAEMHGGNPVLEKVIGLMMEPGMKKNVKILLSFLTILLNQFLSILNYKFNKLKISFIFCNDIKSYVSGMTGNNYLELKS